MKKVQSYLALMFAMFLAANIYSCTGPSTSKTQVESKGELDMIPKTDAQLAKYIVEIFEDTNGNLWFGTMSKGVARYDGETLKYLTKEDGLAGNTVAGIDEDQQGNLWFATHSGLSKYDGSTFTNYTKADGLVEDRVSNMMIDSKGGMWIGTWSGVSRFDGTSFTDFPLPTPDVVLPDYVETKDWVTGIIEDSHGNVWISRSGYGLCKYDPSDSGTGITSYTKKDGLASNCVQNMYEDQSGNIWVGCRVAEKDHPDPDKRFGEGGLSRYDVTGSLNPDGKAFIQFPEVDGLHDNDVYSTGGDKSGNVWIAATGLGLYRYNGNSFTLYDKTDRIDLTSRFGLQSILEDSKGRIWLGFSGGLFRFKGNEIINVSQDGPWH